VAERLLCPQAKRIAIAIKTIPSTIPSPIATLSPVESLCRGCGVGEFDDFDALGLDVDVGSI